MRMKGIDKERIKQRGTEIDKKKPRDMSSQGQSQRDKYRGIG